MTITTQFDLDTNLYHLMCDGPGGLAIAGPRILRGGQHPDIQWSHADEIAAEADAAKLRTYFASLPTKKPSRAAERRQGA
jgi:hypothetical protein